MSVGADPDNTVVAPVNVIVSTYGLDDAAFRAVQADWSTRWRASVKNPEVISVN